MTTLSHHSKVTPELQEQLDNASDRAAGGIVISKSTGNILLGMRSSQVEDPSTYGIFGGRFEDYESPEEAVEREIFEETGFPIFGTQLPLSVFYSKENDFAYHTQIAMAPNDFKSELNWEHDKAEWMSLEQVLAIPKDKIHHGLAKTLENPDVIAELKKITGHYLSNSLKEQANDSENNLSY